MPRLNVIFESSQGQMIAELNPLVMGHWLWVIGYGSEMKKKCIELEKLKDLKSKISVE